MTKENAVTKTSTLQEKKKKKKKSLEKQMKYSAVFSKKTDVPHHANQPMVAILIMTCYLEKKKKSGCHYLPVSLINSFHRIALYSYSIV